MIKKHPKLVKCNFKNNDANVILVRSSEDDGRRLENLASSCD